MRAARRRVCLLAAAALLGCRSNGDGRPPCEDGAPRQDGACTADGEVDTGTGPDPATTDDDGDGFSEVQGDCDDTDRDVYPGAPDAWYDGVDADCDGASDYDQDGDGYDSDAHGGDDCDDARAEVHPGATEVCDADGTDEDCDGLIDAADDSVDPSALQTWYADGDGDGYGAADRAEAACTQPSGTVANDVDCDDLDAEVQGCLETAAHRLLGGFTGDLAGWRVAAAGDVDGDGLEDVLIGAPEADVGGRDAGKAYLLLGRTLAATDPGDLELEDADHVFEGESAYDRAGAAVAGAGDVDGDGLGDVLVGAWGNSVGGFTAGRAYIVLGATLAAAPPGAFPLSDADLTIQGAAAGDALGVAVAAAGDVDGDGLADVLVGADGADPDDREAGAALLFLGRTLAASGAGTLAPSDADVRLIGGAPAAAAGAALAAAGDVDGDGLSDVLLGAPGAPEPVSLFLGRTLTRSAGDLDLSAADYRFLADGLDTGLGSAVASAGDVDGDGRADLILGAWGASAAGSEAGMAYVLLGSTLESLGPGRHSIARADYAFSGEAAGAHAGGSVSSAGDVDRDGLDDLLVAAPQSDAGQTHAGKVYLLLGASLPSLGDGTQDLSDADFSFVGERGYDEAGTAVSPVGDVDGDGYPDLLVGAPGFDDAWANRGAAYRLSGIDLPL